MQCNNSMCNYCTTSRRGRAVVWRTARPDPTWLAGKHQLAQRCSVAVLLCCPLDLLCHYLCESFASVSVCMSACRTLALADAFSCFLTFCAAASSPHGQDVRIIAVETTGAASFAAAQKAGKPVSLPGGITSIATSLGNLSDSRRDTQHLSF